MSNELKSLFSQLSEDPEERALANAVRNFRYENKIYIIMSD